MTGSAKQSNDSLRAERLDCFVACAPRNGVALQNERGLRQKTRRVAKALAPCPPFFCWKDGGTLRFCHPTALNTTRPPSGELTEAAFYIAPRLGSRCDVGARETGPALTRRLIPSLTSPLQGRGIVSFYLGMIFSENRFPPRNQVRDMLFVIVS